LLPSFVMFGDGVVGHLEVGVVGELFPQLAGGQVGCRVQQGVKAGGIGWRLFLERLFPWRRLRCGQRFGDGAVADPEPGGQLAGGRFPGLRLRP